MDEDKCLTAIPICSTLSIVNCLGIAVKLGSVASENVNTAFFQKAETKIELLEPASGQGAISKFIEKKGEGIHHIAFEVNDIKQEMNRLKNEGFVLLNEEPKAGADNKLVCFLHPKSTNGVLIELCQEKGLPGE